MVGGWGEEFSLVGPSPTEFLTTNCCGRDALLVVGSVCGVCGVCVDGGCEAFSTMMLMHWSRVSRM